MNMTIRMLATNPAVLRFAIHVEVEVDMVRPREANVGRYTPKVSSLASSGPTLVAGWKTCLMLAISIRSVESHWAS